MNSSERGIPEAASASPTYSSLSDEFIGKLEGDGQILCNVRYPAAYSGDAIRRHVSLEILLYCPSIATTHRVEMPVSGLGSDASAVSLDDHGAVCSLLTSRAFVHISRTRSPPPGSPIQHLPNTTQQTPTVSLSVKNVGMTTTQRPVSLSRPSVVHTRRRFRRTYPIPIAGISLSLFSVKEGMLAMS